MKVHWVCEHIIIVNQISNIDFLHKPIPLLCYMIKPPKYFTTFMRSFHFINYMCETMRKNLNYDLYFFSYQQELDKYCTIEILISF